MAAYFVWYHETNSQRPVIMMATSVGVARDLRFMKPVEAPDEMYIRAHAAKLSDTGTVEISEIRLMTERQRAVFTDRQAL